MHIQIQILTRQRGDGRADADEDVRAEAGWAALVRALDTDNAAADERAGQTHEHGKRRHVAQAVKTDNIAVHSLQLFDHAKAVQLRQIGEKLRVRYFFIEADREDRTWVQRLATFVPLDIDVVDLHVLRFQLIDDGTDVSERIELHVQIDVTRVLLYVRIHNWEQADAEKYHRECDEHALVKSCADRKAGAGRRPQTSGSGQALDLLAAGNENGSCAQKADAVDDLCAETRNVGFMPISAQISDHGPVTMVNSYRLSSTVSAAPRQTSI